jgi:hypothetical protein
MSGDSLQECKGELLSSCFDSGGISHLLWRGLLGEQRWTADRMGRYRLGEKAGSVLGWPLDPEEAVGERRAMAKLSSAMDNTSHPLNDDSSSD